MLSEIAERVRQEQFASPSIVVVGDVVKEQINACAPEPAAVTMPIPF
jgi:uroporphyrin-III C-methyltransferase